MSIGIILGAVFVLGIVVALYITWNSSNTNNLKNTKKNNNQIERLKRLVEQEENPIKKRILNDQIGHLLLKDAEQRLKPLIQKYSQKVSKNPKLEWKEQLKQYQDELEAANTEAMLLHYDLMAELSDNEKEKYSAFCEAYLALRNSKKVWKIVSKERNTQIKSSADTVVDRASFRFENGIFKELQIPYDVPKIPISSRINYYFYPRFVIVTKNPDDFDVIPISDVSIQFTSTRFHEENLAPADAQKVGTTYRYVNKNGSRDLRFSDNPIILVLLYGEIKIKPFDDVFLVSNNIAAQNWRNSFVELKRESESISNLDSGEKDANRIIHRDSFVSGKADSKDLGKELANQIINSILNRDGTHSPSPTISRLYFEDVLHECKRIQDFSSALSRNEGFLEIVGDKINGDIIVDGKVLTDAKDKLPFYVLGDVLNCYNGLKHSVDLDKPEGLGLLVFSLLFFRPTVEIKYEKLNLLYSCYKTSTEKMLRNPNEATKVKGGKYLLEVCLRDYDKSLHNQYVVLLYRFASLVTKADKIVTETEAKWLNEIIALKEPESEEDVICPTIPDENTKKKTSRASCPSSVKELESLIGLASVKSEINSLTNYIKVQKMRQEKGMKVTPVSYHCVFTGNPGTGKTTVARIVSEIYKELGILKKGHLVETDRSGLVAEYVGQTAVKTNKIIDSALDGILFIDEAYSLVDGGNSDYGKEAIATLLKRMEDDRDRLVVILAGYTNDMKRFIDSNQGLQSRFNRYIEFPDYSAEELFQIFQSSAKKYEYKLTDEAQTALKGVFDKAVTEKDKNFGNGRFVRNLFEKVVEHQANRLSSKADVTSETLALIEKEDIEKSI